jgi:NDP-sugar pyrophosphorylase family protein
MVRAAGFGTRLRPLTLTTPKPLVPVAGRPMIHYPLLWLRSQGVREVVVNTHYLAEQVEAALGDGSGLGVQIIYSREEEILGTGGGLVRVWPLVGHCRLVLVNADTLVSLDLQAVLRRHEEMRAVATLAVTRPADPENYTEVLVDEAGMVFSIGARPERGRPPGGGEMTPVTYTGVAVVEPGLRAYLPAAGFAHLAADGLVPALAGGEKVAAYFHRGYWKAIDNLERLQQAENDITCLRFRSFL